MNALLLGSGSFRAERGDRRSLRVAQVGQLRGQLSTSFGVESFDFAEQHLGAKNRMLARKHFVGKISKILNQHSTIESKQRFLRVV